MPAAAFSVLMYLNANTGEAVKLKVEEDEVEEEEEEREQEEEYVTKMESRNLADEQSGLLERYLARCHTFLDAWTRYTGWLVYQPTEETVDKIIELVGKNASLVILASSLQPPTPLPSPQVLGLKTRRLLQPSRRPATQPSVPTPGQARIDEIILYLFNKMFEY
jgi:hypothetical protein